jgi:hypothetical protein
MPSQKTLDRFQDERDSRAEAEYAALFAAHPTKPVAPAKLVTGYKADEGKPSFTLLPFDALGCIMKVLTFGAIKYAPRNWEKGMNWTRPWDACIRHLEAWMRREDGDPETGMSHLWHAGCMILFLIAYELRGVGTDNRPEAVILKPEWADSEAPAYEGAPLHKPSPTSIR